jgi:hypothetical protein
MFLDPIMQLSHGFPFFYLLFLLSKLSAFSPSVCPYKKKINRRLILLFFVTYSHLLQLMFFLIFLCYILLLYVSYSHSELFSSVYRTLAFFNHTIIFCLYVLFINLSCAIHIFTRFFFFL